MESYTQDFISALKNPSAEYGEVPFYWWTGEKLNKKRLTHQLEELSRNGVAGVQINYAHMVRGGEHNEQYGSHGRTIPGDPLTFSDEWWEFFSFAATECERLGMGIGVGDYTLAWIGNGYFTDVIAADENMQANELSCEKIVYSSDFVLPDDTLAVISYRDEACAEPAVLFPDGSGQTPEDRQEAFLVTIARRPFSIDPMHPECGQRLVDIYFREFERRCPDLKPGTLNYFFQDELSFGCDVKRIWSENLREETKKKYGYDPLGFIPHLFFCLGDLTPKIRLNVNDVKTALMENGYFKPIYAFHASRGMIYGCDQSSRGKDPTEFSDYFRTVRWFTAPGNDTPGRAADLVKVKVNSSIAHLYNRPRTWLEGYHSSGWGTTLESITAPTGDNFIFGANLLNLHGLYYSTNGGFFEWAPPDFHFRMPYWDDEQTWLMKYRRLARLLTTGTHRCDAALFYPTASAVAGQDPEKTVNETFSAAEYIFSRGLDFDFIDCDSLLRAECSGGRLCVAGEKYKVLIFAFNDVINFSVVEVIKKFLDCGGAVVFVGNAPTVSDRAGANDGIFLTEMENILSHTNCAIAANNEALLSFIDRKISRIFLPDGFGEGKIYSACRINGKDRLFYLRYASKDCVCRFEATGSAYLLDARTGDVSLLGGTLSLDGQTIIKLPPELPQDVLILFTDSAIPFVRTVNTSSLTVREPEREILLNDGWDFTVQPTLDNTWGDFYKPAGGVIGLQARFFNCAKVEREGEIPKKYTFTALPYAHTMGVRRIRAQGVAPDMAAAIAGLDGIDSDVILFRDTKYEIEYLRFSDRCGIITDDEESQKFEQGYHGLKGRIYDDNFVFETDSVFLAQIDLTEEKTVKPVLSGQKPDCLYIGGVKITDYTQSVTLKAGRTCIVAAYTVKENDEIFRNRARMKKGGIHFAVGEETKALYELSKCDFMNAGYLHYGSGGIYVYTFRTAPGFSVMSCSVAGRLLSAYNDGREMSVLPCGEGDFGTRRYEVRAANVNRDISEVRMYVQADDGLAFTGAIPCPIDLFCAGGTVSTGDLSLTNSALTCYSGKMIYSRSEDLGELRRDCRYLLSAEDVGATLKIEINGFIAAVLTYAPFTADITDWLRDGVNAIKLTVSNTLCNHYSTIPSRYSNFPRDAKSGLIGDVKITVRG